MMVGKSFFFYIFLLFVPAVQTAASDFKELQVLREELSTYSYADSNSFFDSYFDSRLEINSTMLLGSIFGGLNGVGQIAFFRANERKSFVTFFKVLVGAVLGAQQGYFQGLAARTGHSLPQLPRARLLMYMAIHHVLVFTAGIFAGTVAGKQQLEFDLSSIGIVAGNIVGFILLLPEILFIKSDRKALAKEVEKLKNTIQNTAFRSRRLEVS